MSTYIFDYDEEKREELKFEYEEDYEIQRFEKGNKYVLYFKGKDNFRLIYIKKHINDGNIKSYEVKSDYTYDGDLVSNIDHHKSINEEILNIMDIRFDFYANVIMPLEAMTDVELDLAMDYIKKLKSSI